MCIRDSPSAYNRIVPIWAKVIHIMIEGKGPWRHTRMRLFSQQSGTISYPLILFLGMLLTAGECASSADHLIHSFKKTQLSDKFWCEGATLGDLNRDGKPDIVSGPYWYEGPDYKK